MYCSTAVHFIWTDHMLQGNSSPGHNTQSLDAGSVCSPKKTTWKLQIYRICYVYVPLVIITQTTTRVVSLSTMTDMGRIYRYPESGIDMESTGKCRRGGPWKRVYNNHTVVGLGIPKNIHIDSQQPHIELSSAYYQLRQYSPNKIQQQQS